MRTFRVLALGVTSFLISGLFVWMGTESRVSQHAVFGTDVVQEPQEGCSVLRGYSPVSACRSDDPSSSRPRTLCHSALNLLHIEVSEGDGWARVETEILCEYVGMISVSIDLPPGIKLIEGETNWEGAGERILRYVGESGGEVANIKAVAMLASGTTLRSSDAIYFGPRVNRIREGIRVGDVVEIPGIYRGGMGEQ